jgi:adenylate cyclase class IV/N-acetylglutamate synthase-like GNAT family acetyltransferase
VPRNVEIKARVRGLAAVRARAVALASSSPVILRQADTFFSVEQGRLKVRDFGDGTGELIAYQRPNAAGPKTSEYVRVPCDPELMCAALGAVLGAGSRVIKKREVVVAGRTRIHLDEVERLGSFVELEVVLREGESEREGQAEIPPLMAALGIAPASLVAGAYVDLLDALPPLIIRRAQAGEMDKVRGFYRMTGYGGPVNPSDRVFVAEEAASIVGVVRVCDEDHVQTLRGMRVRADRRHARVGTTLLAFAVQELGQGPCYMVLSADLQEFYRQAGFETIADAAAPMFIAKRAAEYRAGGRDVVIMQRVAPNALSTLESAPGIVNREP